MSCAPSENVALLQAIKYYTAIETVHYASIVVQPPPKHKNNYYDSDIDSLSMAAFFINCLDFLVPENF